MPFELKRSRIDKLTRDQILAALIKASAHYKLVEFGKRDFNEGHFGCTAAVVRRQFGSWSAGIAALREELAKSGKRLEARSHDFISEKDLFLEMERIWHLSGQRPSRHQWEQHSPRYSYGTYKRRFGGWQQACLKFVENKMGAHIETQGNAESQIGEKQITTPLRAPAVRESVPLRLRLRVLDRDGFKCVLCGRSPAKDFGVQLHIDHVLPVSHGGKPTYENLRTLCAQCNLGRGDIVGLAP